MHFDHNVKNVVDDFWIPNQESKSQILKINRIQIRGFELFWIFRDNFSSKKIENSANFTLSNIVQNVPRERYRSAHIQDRSSDQIDFLKVLKNQFHRRSA
jgi:hypothetical protein